MVRDEDGPISVSPPAAAVTAGAEYWELDLTDSQRLHYALQGEAEPTVGMQLQTQTPEGQVMQLVITEVAEETFTVDANHPLAGQDLTFELTLVEVSS